MKQQQYIAVSKNNFNSRRQLPFTHIKYEEEDEDEFITALANFTTKENTKRCTLNICNSSVSVTI